METKDVVSDKTEFVIAKEPYSEYGSNKARYYSITNGYNAYFDYGKSPLAEAKKYAREHGFLTMRLLGNKWNTKDKIYTINKKQ